LSSALIELGSYWYAFGGVHTKRGIIDTVERYDPIIDEWLLVEPLPRSVCSPAVAAFNGKIYLCGKLNILKILSGQFFTFCSIFGRRTERGIGLNPISLNPLPPSDAVRQQKKNIFEDLFSSVLSQFKKYHPSGNLKFYNLGILKSLKLRILEKKSF